MAIRSLKTGLFSRSGMAGNPVIMPGSYESIATIDVGAGGVSSVTFSSIPSTYSHLQIRVLANGVYSATDYHDISLQFNSDTGANYAWHRVRGNGTNAATGGAASANFGNANYIGVSSTANSMFGASIIDVLDYKDTSKYKTFKAFGGFDSNGGGGGVGLTSSLWMNTSAITSIKLYSTLGDLRQYSSFALYGVN